MSRKFFSFRWLGLQLYYLLSIFSFPQSFQIISISPSFNEIANYISPEISVTFKIPVEPASFDSISFSVFGERSAYYRGELTFLNENKVVSFNSYQNFNAGERVTVSLSGKILSAEGDSLKGFTWTFRIPTKQKPLHFSEPVEYGGGGFGMKCIDMNNDGHPDIVTSSGVILINDGNGGFPTYWYLDDADGFYNIIVADFNRDGFMDVFYGNIDNLVLGLGNGSGNFTKSYYPWWFLNYTSADINNDGYPDLIGVNNVSVNPPYDTTAYFAIALNDGTGQFNDTSWGGQLTGTFQNIITTDVNNDGDLDILIISWLTGLPYPFPFGLNGLAVFRNNGEGVFDEYQLYPACNEFNIMFPEYIYSSDFNNDGLVDIAVLGYAGGITLNKANGIFGECFDTTYIRYFRGAELPATFTGGDINGDGWIDLAVSGLAFHLNLIGPNNLKY